MSEQNDRTDAVTILLEQYKICAQLYQHEDNLTWTKLQRLLLLSAALLAVFGVTLADFEKFAVVSIIVTFFGSAISLAFCFSIWNGSMFITLRRQNTLDIEEELIKRGGARILADDSNGLDEIARERAFGMVALKAKTYRMLFWISLLLTIAWIALFLGVVILNVNG